MKTEIMTRVILTVLMRARLRVPPVIRRIPSFWLTVWTERTDMERPTWMSMCFRVVAGDLLDSSDWSRPGSSRKWRWRRWGAWRTSWACQIQRIRSREPSLGRNWRWRIARTTGNLGGIPRGRWKPFFFCSREERRRWVRTFLTPPYSCNPQIVAKVITKSFFHPLWLLSPPRLWCFSPLISW